MSPVNTAAPAPEKPPGAALGLARPVTPCAEPGRSIVALAHEEGEHPGGVPGRAQRAHLEPPKRSDCPASIVLPIALAGASLARRARLQQLALARS